MVVTTSFYSFNDGIVLCGRACQRPVRNESDNDRRPASHDRAPELCSSFSFFFDNLPEASFEAGLFGHLPEARNCHLFLLLTCNIRHLTPPRPLRNAP